MATQLVLDSATTATRAPGGVREVGLLAFPVFLQMATETVCQLVNSAFVGRLGATELGAIGLGGIWLWTLLSPFGGTASGVQTFVSRADGEGKPAECGPWIWHALWTLLPPIVVWSAAMWVLFEPLMAAIGPSAELQARTAEYAHARLLGFPAVVAGITLTSFFRGLGITRLPMIAAMVSVAVDVVLAYGLVYGRLGLPEWGVYGAGMAFVVAEYLNAGLLVAFLLLAEMRRYSVRPRAPDLRAILRFLRTSAPIGGQWVLDMTSFALFSSIVARMGDADMAASQAMLQLLSISYHQAFAISIGAGTLVGRYLGAGQPDLAERSYFSAVKLALALAATVAALFLGAPELLMRIFSDDPAVLALARPLLLLGAFFQVIDAIAIIASGSLRGAGDTRWPFAVQATLAWVVRIPLVWTAAIWMGGGVFGAWLGELGFILILGLAFVLRFRAGHWRTIRL
jgi:MATE family multidrug resistance protein